ncbi:cytochrome P450 [Streptomyces sp. NPDC101150]|uniref:cytochrome P450 n=1 Tax=Streptomyces sp. NPDC101150 TaxID=3366114 RepID=UPI0037FE06E0
MPTHVINELPPTPGDGGDNLVEWTGRLRATSPVWFNEMIKVWHVFDHATTQQILSDTTKFSSDLSAIAPAKMFMKGNFMRMDPPDHRKHRTLISQAFTARTVSGLEPRITEIVHELLDEAEGAERFDLVRTLSFPLPVTVIAALLGVSADDRPLFRKWADDMFSANFDKPFDPARIKEVEDAAVPMHDYLLEHVRLRRKEPKDDLITRLVQAELDGERLDDEEAVTFAALLLIAGHVTTTLLVNNAVRCLDENPHLFASLRADPAGIPALVEEVLRYRPPFLGVPRMTTEDVVLGGETVPAGSVVVPSLLAANRDPARFPDPDRFDPARDNTHIAFGHGIHFCLGAPLARMEARIALGILLDRYAEIRLDEAEAPEFFQAQGILGPKRLPVRVRAAR